MLIDHISAAKLRRMSEAELWRLYQLCSRTAQAISYPYDRAAIVPAGIDADPVETAIRLYALADAAWDMLCDRAAADDTSYDYVSA